MASLPAAPCFSTCVRCFSWLAALFPVPVGSIDAVQVGPPRSPGHARLGTGTMLRSTMTTTHCFRNARLLLLLSFYRCSLILASKHIFLRYMPFLGTARAAATVTASICFCTHAFQLLLIINQACSCLAQRAGQQSHIPYGQGSFGEEGLCRGGLCHVNAAGRGGAQ